MRDPHVEWLRYRLLSPETTVYDRPPPITINEDAFDAILEDGILPASMRDHFPEVIGARRVVETYLRAWEIRADLEIGFGSTRFRYEDAQVVDRQPPSRANEASVEFVAVAGGSVSARVTRRTYPSPPTDFKVTPDVETLWHRYECYREGKEPLPGMAYFCLAFLLQRYGGEGRPSRRTAAARALDVDEAILSKLGDLTTNRGDATTARKAVIDVPPTADEQRWIEVALIRLIRHLGELAARKSERKLVMSDLPVIP